MKKITKLLFLCLMIGTLAGCSGNTDAQEEVVTTFFDELAEGNAKKIKKLMTKRADDDIAILYFMNTLDNAFDEGYGNTWNKKRKSCIADIYEDLIESYEITGVEASGDETVIKVRGKRVKYENFSYTEDVSSTKELEEFEEELEEVYEKYAYNEYDTAEFEEEKEEVYKAYAKEYFKLMKEAFEKLRMTSFTITFTLVEKDGKWLIEEIGGKKEWPEFPSYQIDYSNEYEIYTVDQDACKAENTILGKGRLLDSYNNEKEVETLFNFLDFNVTNATGEEIDAYGYLTLSAPIKLEMEVSGEVGETLVVLVQNESFETIFSETITLTEEHMVITRDITELDATAQYVYMQLLVGNGYNEAYEYGDQFGYYLIWNK